ncbi:MAG TPA: VWA domain-containing protein [Pyrinomonadaceae bacterium]|nr:VWA domain-containing protein [Pyrinomonadaceae bacterium]
MRRRLVLSVLLISGLCLAGLCASDALSQAQRRRVPARDTPPKPVKAPSPAPTPEASPEPLPEPELQDVDTLRIATDLVTVPVISTTREGHYIADLRQEEFNVSENGVKQEVAFFATVSAPFHVVLMLDTSGSTREKIGLIREAAISFVDQLQQADRVKVISFDDQVRELSDFTNDRPLLRNAINKTMPGRGTKLYDAFEVALSSIRNIKGRKAIVLFSDGVDHHSDRASFDGTLHWLDEESVIVYPIRYDTREATARLMREQIDEQQGPQLPTIGVIRAPTTTAPTFPSDDPGNVPTSSQTRKTGPFGLPSASEILRRRSENEREERERENQRNGGRYPDRYPSPGDPRPTDPGNTRTDTRSSGRRAEDDMIRGELDRLYLMADSYLMDLANKSGGQLLRADTLGSLPAAFAKIAAELRTQYAIGYYPVDKKRDGTYRKIKVTTTRKNTSVRARPGYRRPRGE